MTTRNRRKARSALTAEFYKARDCVLNCVVLARIAQWRRIGQTSALQDLRDALKVYRADRRSYWRAYQ